MATALKCPNPSCSFVFDPSTVPAGVVLACQRCGMRFTLGSPRPQTPNSQPTGFPGTHASPASPAENTAFANARTQVGPAPAAAAGAVAQAPAREPREVKAGPHTSRFQMFALAGVSALALSIAALVAWYKLTHKDQPTAADNATTFRELNLEFVPPPSPWVRDEETRVTLGSPFKLVYRRDNPEAFMAFGAKDYDPRSPRESELQNGLMLPLSKVVDITTLKQDEGLEKTWMGQPIKGFKFHAQLKSGTTVDGEAYRFANKGIGYWFLSWTGENNIFEEMQPSFAEARKHCKLLDLRSNWKERQSSTVPFKGDRVGYTILDAEGVWEEEKDESNLKFEGEYADKLLKLKPTRKKDDVTDARLIVYVLPGDGDPAAVARKYVTQRRTDEIKAGAGLTVDFVELTGAIEGDPVSSAIESPLPVLRLQSLVKGASDQNRYHVISASKVEDKIVVVHVFCSLIKRSLLESTFIQIASSLHGK